LSRSEICRPEIVKFVSLEALRASRFALLAFVMVDAMQVDVVPLALDLMIRLSDVNIP
jgi:hypothetical protein